MYLLDHYSSNKSWVNAHCEPGTMRKWYGKEQSPTSASKQHTSQKQMLDPPLQWAKGLRNELAATYLTPVTSSLSLHHSSHVIPYRLFFNLITLALVNSFYSVNLVSLPDHHTTRPVTPCKTSLKLWINSTLEHALSPFPALCFLFFVYCLSPSIAYVLWGQE